MVDFVKKPAIFMKPWLAFKVVSLAATAGRSMIRAVARALIGGGGGCIFIYSGSARLVSFEIKLISKEASRAEPEYMNIHPPPPPPQLAF